MAPQYLPEGERRDTVTISKKLYDAFVWGTSILVLGVSGLFWNLHLNDVHQDGIIARLEKFADAGDRCTRETCQNTSNLLTEVERRVTSLEATQALDNNHRQDSTEGYKRIRVCEACCERLNEKINGITWRIGNGKQ